MTDDEYRIKPTYAKNLALLLITAATFVFNFYNLQAGRMPLFIVIFFAQMAAMYAVMKFGEPKRPRNGGLH